MEETTVPNCCMVVVAHADDAEWGCAGSVALWSSLGSKIVYVICTDGSKGSDDLTMTSDDLRKIRRSEQEAAAKVLGVQEVVFLGYEDSMLEPTLALRKDIVREIRKFKPDVLITQNPIRSLANNHYIGHPDHIAAGEATFSAIFPAARDRLTFPDLIQEGLEPHKVRMILIPYQDQVADIWIDVSKTIDKAVTALEQHKSQVPEGNADRYLRQGRKKVGVIHGVEYAEAFKSFNLS